MSESSSPPPSTAHRSRRAERVSRAPSRDACSCSTARWARTSSATIPTPEDFGGKSLEGCNDHLVLTRPDIIQSIHESFLAVGCDVVETCTFQSDAAPPARVGPRGQDARAERRGGAPRARRVRQVRDARPAALRRRLDRADGHAAVEQRPGALEHHLRRARRELLRAGEVPRRRRRRRAARRDGAGHPRGEGGDRRLRAAVRRDRATRRRSRRRSRSTRAAACCSAPTSRAR